MPVEPSLHGLGVAVGQRIDDRTPLQVHHDGAVGLALAPGPVVDANETGWGRRVMSDLLDAPEQRVGADGHGEAEGQSGPGLAPEGVADRLVGPAEPGRGASEWLGEPREALGEDAPRAVRERAEEAADGDVEPD